jgi:hypothetical protein
MGPLATGVGGRGQRVDLVENDDCNGRRRVKLPVLGDTFGGVPLRGHRLTPKGICLYFFQSPRERWNVHSGGC